MLREIKEGSVSLIVYGDDAYVVSPLTEDSNTIMSIVPTLNPNLPQNEGVMLKMDSRKHTNL